MLDNIFYTCHVKLLWIDEI
uniref:Uncharacterized protein n=1 Tax=Rhizophora mucronata TaxID=61149 RepID=A0A2P2QYN4_RHIMU